MGLAKRVQLEEMDAEARRCSECEQDDAYDTEAVEDQPQATCRCGTFEWWCDACRHGYDGDCCEVCLERATSKDE